MGSMRVLSPPWASFGKTNGAIPSSPFTAAARVPPPSAAAASSSPSSVNIAAAPPMRTRSSIVVLTACLSDRDILARPRVASIVRVRRRTRLRRSAVRTPSCNKSRTCWRNPQLSLSTARLPLSSNTLRARATSRSERATAMECCCREVCKNSTNSSGIRASPVATKLLTCLSFTCLSMCATCRVKRSSLSCRDRESDCSTASMSPGGTSFGSLPSMTANCKEACDPTLCCACLSSP
eukprot:scaffold46091_cov92-Phaeocystis_antarctica.AAC.3